MRPFLQITSDWGRIGNFLWVNAQPAPYRSPLNLCMETRWGGVGSVWDDPSCYTRFSVPTPFPQPTT